MSGLSWYVHPSTGVQKICHGGSIIHVLLVGLLSLRRGLDSYNDRLAPNTVLFTSRTPSPEGRRAQGTIGLVPDLMTPLFTPRNDGTP